jgi:hypothetical protein
MRPEFPQDFPDTQAGQQEAASQARLCPVSESSCHQDHLFVMRQPFSARLLTPCDALSGDLPRRGPTSECSNLGPQVAQVAQAVQVAQVAQVELAPLRLGIAAPHGPDWGCSLGRMGWLDQKTQLRMKEGR